MSLALAMIVKNEAAVIERCLSSVKPHVDAWVVVDTGSTDGTQELVRQAMEGLDGELVERPWRGFHENRTEALALAKDRADYTLMVDADEELVRDKRHGFSGSLSDNLIFDAYRLRIQLNDTSFLRTLITSNAMDWHYDGARHHVLKSSKPARIENLEGLALVNRNDGARGKDPAISKKRFEGDVAALREALERDPGHPRNMFYLAQSYRDCGQVEAAMATYERRARMGGFPEEVWYSLYQVARMKHTTGRPRAEVIDAYLTAYNLRPSRAESLVHLSIYLRGLREYALSHMFAQKAVGISRPNDLLFLEDSHYTWRSLDEVSVAAYHLGDFQESYDMAVAALIHHAPPEPHRSRIEKNRDFSMEKLGARSTMRPPGQPAEKPFMRWDLINDLLREPGSQGRFLEIGVRRGETGSQVNAGVKCGVDPSPNPDAKQHYDDLFIESSDFFFDSLDSKIQYDVVLIDGLHHAEQVYRDVLNSLDHLAPGGTIVLHDCNPQTELAQEVPHSGQRIWNGDCWKAIVQLRAQHYDLKTYVIDADEGLGIVQRQPAASLCEVSPQTLEDGLSWEDLEKDRQHLLGLTPVCRWRVVIPSNDAKRLRRAVAAVLRCHQGMRPEWIFVVDDGAQKDWTKDDPDVTWVGVNLPFVFSRNVNRGIAAAAPYDVVLMGDDGEPQTDNAFNRIASTSSIVSAGINGLVGNPAQQWKEGEGQLTSEVALAFVCVYLPRSVLDEVGDLDERFVGYGSEDTDYCRRAQKAGVKLAIEPSVQVDHNDGPEMESAWRSRSDQPEQRRANQRLLAEKWAHAPE